MPNGDLYIAIYQSECAICGTAPVVGFWTPSGQLASTNFCGSHFFGDRAMMDVELWNLPKEATE